MAASGVTLTLPHDIIRYLIQSGFLETRHEDAQVLGVDLQCLGLLALTARDWYSATWSSLDRLSILTTVGAAGDYSPLTFRRLPPPWIILNKLERLRYLRCALPFRSASQLIQRVVHSLEMLHIDASQLCAASLCTLGSLRLNQLQTLIITCPFEISAFEWERRMCECVTEFLGKLEAPMLRTLSAAPAMPDQEFLSYVGSKFCQLQYLKLLASHSRGGPQAPPVIDAISELIDGSQPRLFPKLRWLGLSSLSVTPALNTINKLLRDVELSATADPRSRRQTEDSLFDAFEKSFSMAKESLLRFSRRLDAACRISFLVRSNYASSLDETRPQLFDSLDMLGLLCRWKAPTKWLQAAAANLLVEEPLFDAETSPLGIDDIVPTSALECAIYSFASKRDAETEADSLTRIDLALSSSSAGCSSVGNWNRIIDVAVKTGRPAILRHVLKRASERVAQLRVAQSVINSLVSSKPEQVKELLDALVEFPIEGDTPVSPLMAAALSLHPPDISLPLIEHMVKLSCRHPIFDVNKLSDSGESVMHFLLAENLPSRTCTACVDLILASGYRIDSSSLQRPCPDGLSLLTHATRHPQLQAMCEAVLQTTHDEQKRDILALRLNDICSQKFEGTTDEIRRLAPLANLSRCGSWSALLVAAEQTQSDLINKLTILLDAGSDPRTSAFGVSSLDLLCSRSPAPEIRRCLALILDRSPKDSQADLASNALVHLSNNSMRSPAWTNILEDLVAVVIERNQRSCNSKALWALAGLHADPQLLQSAQSLLKRGADPNFVLPREERISTLTRAFQAGNGDFVRILLASGADPTKAEDGPYMPTCSCTLSRAVGSVSRSSKGLDDLQILLARCPSPLPSDALFACIYEIASSPRFDNNYVFGLLIAKHVAEYRDKFGDTVLHCAVSHGHIPLIEYLLTIPRLFDELWHVENIDGRTPLSIAILNEHSHPFHAVCAPILSLLFQVVSSDVETVLKLSLELSLEYGCRRSREVIESLQESLNKSVRRPTNRKNDNKGTQNGPKRRRAK